MTNARARNDGRSEAAADESNKAPSVESAIANADERRRAKDQTGRGQEGAGGSGDDASLQSVAESRSDRAAGKSS